MTHELDNYRAKRKARIEYKHQGEAHRFGQELHHQAELESVSPEWHGLFVLVVDDGQTGAQDEV
jgi:hypothetical protein